VRGSAIRSNSRPRRAREAGRLAARLAVIVSLFLSASASAQEVALQLESAIELAAAAVERQFARVLPVPAASAGVSYSFDPATGNFRRDPSTYGQIYLERADPLAARRFNVSFVYQYVQLDTIEGHDAGDLRNAHPIPFEGLRAAFEIPSLDLAIRTHQFLFALTYGITDDLEASVAVPVIYSDLDAEGLARVVGVRPNGELIFLEEDLTESDDVVGIGDVLLRAKYRLAELRDLRLAAGLSLRFPSGNEEDVQGIGYFEVTPALLASTRIFQPASWARLQGYGNAGIDFDTDDVGNSDARWGFGLDWGFTDDLTASVAFLAQNQFARVAPAGTFTVPACQSDLVTCAIDESVRVGSQQLFGLTGERPDYYTLAVGGRGALWRDTVFAFASVAIPLNDGFVRMDPIPLVGFEGTF